ncbi:MAG: hypothetical protein JJU46_11440 [Balneolaceae bacterium]|nr:hypothetical protein [Balneolaceae bacterium]MCH8549243.1 hypothetical protein [Balneolaceae bacterium]
MNYRLLTIALVAAFIGACSDNSSSILDDQFGEVTFNISGDITGEKSGMADFYSMSSFGISTWEISMSDFNPSTFSLVIMAFSNEDIERPGTGTYPIGPNSESDLYFSAYYADESIDYEEYSSDFEGFGGTLTITESNSDRIRGTFQMTLGMFDYDNGEVIGEVAISSGSFTALPRQF